MKRLLSIFCLLVGTAGGQTSYDQLFSAYKSTSLSGAAETVTVQHVASYVIGGVTYSTKPVKFVSAYLYCSVACTVTLERGGTAASSTALAIVNVNPRNPNKQSTTSQAYSSSNVGVGTIINTYTIGAGNFVSIDLSLSQMLGGVADNFTFRTSSITGTAAIQLMWYEQ